MPCNGDLAAKARSEGGLGASAWASVLLVPGLRFGAAASRFTVRDGPLRVGTSDDWKTLLLSVDGSFTHWDLRARPGRPRHPLTLSGDRLPHGRHPRRLFLELGAAFRPKLWLHVQGEYQTG